MTKNKKEIIIKILVILFWIIIWQLISNKINQELLLASPLNVLKQIIYLIFEKNFWERVFFSYINITLGFCISIIIGIILSIMAYKFTIIKILLNPVMLMIKSVPVVAIIILFLVWSTSNNLPIIISIFMTLPIIYTNLLKALNEVDQNLLEMAKVFNMTILKKIKYIYIFEVLPYFEAAGITALGIAWKSGIAAEVIGLPKNSIGEAMYESKIYFNTVDLFVWALVIILLGYLSEKIFIIIIKIIIMKIERVK